MVESPRLHSFSYSPPVLDPLHFCWAGNCPNRRHIFILASSSGCSFPFSSLANSFFKTCLKYSPVKHFLPYPTAWVKPAIVCISQHQYSNAYSVVFAVTSFHRWSQLDWTSLVEEVCLIHVYVPSSYYGAQHILNRMFQINANGTLKQPKVETALKAGKALQLAPCMQCHLWFCFLHPWTRR